MQMREKNVVLMEEIGVQYSVLPFFLTFVRRPTSSGSEFFLFFGSGFVQIFGQLVSLRIGTLENTNLVASRHRKREKRLF